MLLPWCRIGPALSSSACPSWSEGCSQNCTSPIIPVPLPLHYRHRMLPDHPHPPPPAVPACAGGGAGALRPLGALLPGGCCLRLLHALGRHGGLLCVCGGGGAGADMVGCCVRGRQCRAGCDELGVAKQTYTILGLRTEHGVRRQAVNRVAQCYCVIVGAHSSPQALCRSSCRKALLCDGPCSPPTRRQNTRYSLPGAR